MRQLVTVPVDTHLVTFWRHFAVLTSFSGLGHIRDHLFLGREGAHIWKSWKFKVVVLSSVFETGSMPGLMTKFSRHSRFMTNFSILYIESRLYWVQRGILSARSQGVRRARDLAWSALVDAEPLYLALVGPWQYQSWAQGGGWVGTTLPHPPRYPPGSTPLPVPRCTARTAVLVGACCTAVSRSAKEILGVNNAHQDPGPRSTPHAHLTQAPRSPPEPACGACCALGRAP